MIFLTIIKRPTLRLFLYYHSGDFYVTLKKNTASKKSPHNQDIFKNLWKIFFKIGIFDVFCSIYCVSLVRGSKSFFLLVIKTKLIFFNVIFSNNNQMSTTTVVHLLTRVAIFMLLQENTRILKIAS